MPSAMITVVVPTRNRADHLRRAVASVLGQTRGDLRLVISDNASVDGTAALVAGLEDPRVVSVRHPSDLGMVGNFNAALRRVDTPYVALLLDDDAWEPRFLERTVPVLEQDERLGLVHTAFRVVDVADRELVAHEDWHAARTPSRRQDGRAFLAEVLGSPNPVLVSAALLRTAALPPGLFDARDVQAEDLGCWMRLALDWDVSWLDEVLAVFRRHAGSVSVAAAVEAGDATVPSYDQVAMRRRTADRFLDEEGHRLGDVEHWRRVAARKARADALETTWWLAQCATGPGEVARLLRRADLAAPGVWAQPHAWRMLAAAGLPRPLVTRLRRGRPTPATVRPRSPTAR